jgi:transposase, IS6 family
MILNALIERLKRRSKDDFKGRHYEAALILQAVSWYLRYPLSYRDIEELFRERGLEIDHSTLNRWVLAYAPLIERRLRTFRKPHCGSVRVDETYIKVRGQWRCLYQAIDKHSTSAERIHEICITPRRSPRPAMRDSALLRRNHLL